MKDKSETIMIQVPVKITHNGSRESRAAAVRDACSHLKVDLFCASTEKGCYSVKSQKGAKEVQP